MLRIKRAVRPPSDQWKTTPVEKRGSTKFGLSFRPRQAKGFGLEARATLKALLQHPYPLIRLAAYWNEIEPEPGAFEPAALDWQVEAAEQSGKEIILCVGAVKSFGYPEFYVPAHHLAEPLKEGALVGPATHGPLLDTACAFIARLVERYRDRPAIVAWQVEHEAVDPLGLEHSWRLAAAFVEREVETVRRTDPSRPILMNSYLPASIIEGLPQWWRTRDQGDSLRFAARAADIVGIDYYPRHALVGVGPWSVYLDAISLKRSTVRPVRMMVTEGQAEPWERVTTPPNPPTGVMYSCPPEQLIENYNRAMRAAGNGTLRLEAYLFWGAEYWLLRARSGDPTYLNAFRRVLDESA